MEPKVSFISGIFAPKSPEGDFKATLLEYSTGKQPKSIPPLKGARGMFPGFPQPHSHCFFLCVKSINRRGRRGKSRRGRRGAFCCALNAVLANVLMGIFTINHYIYSPINKNYVGIE